MSESSRGDDPALLVQLDAVALEEACRQHYNALGGTWDAYTPMQSQYDSHERHKEQVRVKARSLIGGYFLAIGEADVDG